MHNRVVICAKTLTRPHPLLIMQGRSATAYTHGSAGGESEFREEEGRAMEAYCLKCRTKREVQGAKAITMKNGKPATEGTCPVCGTKIFKIGKA